MLLMMTTLGVGGRRGEALRMRREARLKGTKRPGAQNKSLQFLGYMSLCP